MHGSTCLDRTRARALSFFLSFFLPSCPFLCHTFAPYAFRRGLLMFSYFSSPIGLLHGSDVHVHMLGARLCLVGEGQEAEVQHQQCKSTAKVACAGGCCPSRPPSRTACKEGSVRACCCRLHGQRSSKAVQITWARRIGDCWPQPPR